MKNPIQLSFSLFLIAAFVLSSGCEDFISDSNPTQHTIKAPFVPEGADDGFIGCQYTFIAVVEGATCSFGHPITMFKFDWGDGTETEWESGSQSHIYENTADYQISVMCRCSEGLESDWSPFKEFGVWERDTLVCTADAYVCEALPDSNFGGADSLVVGNISGKFFLLIDFATETLQEDIEIFSSSLHLYSESGGMNTPFAIRIGWITDDWSEMTVNWNQLVNGYYYIAHTWQLNTTSGWTKLECADEVKSIIAQNIHKGLTLFNYELTGIDFYKSFVSRESANGVFLEIGWRPVNTDTLP